MCYAASCNPLCGDCRPKRIVQVRCPECGAVAQMTRDEYLLYFDLPHRKSVLEQKIVERGGVPDPLCGQCGAALTEAFRAEIQPAECKSNRILCGFPCGRKSDPYREGSRGCPTMVPLGKLA